MAWKFKEELSAKDRENITDWGSWVVLHTWTYKESLYKLFSAPFSSDGYL